MTDSADPEYVVVPMKRRHPGSESESESGSDSDIEDLEDAVDTVVSIYDTACHSIREGTAGLSPTLDPDDVRCLVECLEDADEPTGHMSRVLQALQAWASAVIAPVDNGTPEQRAFRVLFFSAFDLVSAGDSIVVSHNGQSLQNMDAVEEAARRSQALAFYATLILRGMEVTLESRRLSVAILHDVTESVRRASRLLGSYRDAVRSAVLTLMAEFNDTSHSRQYDSFMSLDIGDSTVAFHVREIMKDMVVHRYRRLAKYAYRPNHETGSAAERVQPLDSIEGIDGIYQSVRMVQEPVYCWFDPSTHRIVGDRYDQETVPYGLMVADYHEATPDAPRDPRAFWTSSHRRTARFRGLWDAWRARRLVLAVRCTKAGCCDLMHCRRGQCPVPWDVARAQYQGGLFTTPFNNEANRDPTVGDRAHTFTPVFKPRRRHMTTNAYKKHGSTSDYIRAYFNPSRNPQGAQDVLRERILETIQQWADTHQWFQDLEIQANRHCLAFADGFLVCDHTLEEVPTFYPYESHVFRSGGRYHSLQTVKVESSLIYRPYACDGMWATVLPEATLPAHVFHHHRGTTGETGEIPLCGKCGLPREECEAVNLGMVVDDLFYAPKAEWATRAAGDGGAEGILRTMELMECPEIIDRHAFCPHRKPTRRDCRTLAMRMDLSQFDEIPLAQLEHPSIWVPLPEAYRDPGPGAFYATQIERMSYEVRALLGRLLYRNREFTTQDQSQDTWQFFLFIKGASGTGKSTILNLIERIVGKENVKIMDCATYEKTFGLYPLLTSDLTAINEVAGEVSFSPNTILQMVDRSQMSAPRKNKDVYTGEMRGPLILLGNRAPNTNLKAGQWERRQLLLSFDRVMTQSKPSLEKEITHLHFGHLVTTLYLAYWSFVEEHHHRDIWCKRPSVLGWLWHHQREKSEAHSNALGKILRSFRDMSMNDSPAILMHPPDHADRIRETMSFLHSKAWREREGFMVPEDVPFLDQGTPLLCYMPFEAMEIDTETHPGFKALCNHKFTDLSGTMSKHALPWSDEEDFYRVPFSAHNLFVYTGRLPCPPWGHTLVHARWIVGITDRSFFKDGDTTHSSYENLKGTLV
jgi:hypothetical protein